MAVASDNQKAPVLPLKGGEIPSELTTTTTVEPSSVWGALNLRELWLYRTLLVTIYEAPFL